MFWRLMDHLVEFLKYLTIPSLVLLVNNFSSKTMWQLDSSSILFNRGCKPLNQIGLLLGRTTLLQVHIESLCAMRLAEATCDASHQ